jgi:hypothetical protein
MIRWIALIENPEKPHYSKKIRNQFIFSPGKLVNHARQLVLKVSHAFAKEVLKLKAGLQFPEIVSAQTYPQRGCG